MQLMEESDDIRIVLSPETLVHPDVRQLFCYWQETGQRSQPLASSFDILNIPEIIPWIYVLKRSRPGADWVAKMFGSNLSSRLNLHASEAEFASGKAVAPRATTLLHSVAKTGEPHASGPLRPRLKKLTPYLMEHLVVPFFDDDGIVTLMCGIARPIDVAET